MWLIGNIYVNNTAVLSCEICPAAQFVWGS